MALVLLAVLLSACRPPGEEKVPYDEKRTLVVVLGSGTPRPDPDRSGPAVAIVAGGRAYLVDCGPGIVRQAQAAFLAGIEPLEASLLSRAFITHLHSDHTAGYPDLVLSPWVVGREEPLEVYGPPGLSAMNDHVLAAWSEDIDVRLHGVQPSNETGIVVLSHEIQPGPVYDDGTVKVTAFAVDHGDWKNALGYRFDSKDRSIVVSGDTVPTDAVVEACSGCDVLVHEVYAKAGFDTREKEWQDYHRVSHTSGIELGAIAARARPKLLVLYHQLMWGATREQLLSEVARSFQGRVEFADDLDVF